MNDPRERCIEETLTRIALRRGLGFKPQSARTPAEVMMDAEEGDTLDENRIRVETGNRLLDFFFQDGPDPGRAMKHLFAIVRKVRPELLEGLSLHEQALMFGETKQAASWRVKQLGRFLRRRGVKGYLSRSEKSAAASQSYARREQRKAKRAA